MRSKNRIKSLFNFQLTQPQKSVDQDLMIHQCQQISLINYK